MSWNIRECSVCPRSLQCQLKPPTNGNSGVDLRVRALPPGPERDHFLAVATPDNVASMKSSDPTGQVFARADYGRSYSALTSYTPCAVWTWLVCRQQEPKILAYNDV